MAPKKRSRSASVPPADAVSQNEAFKNAILAMKCYPKARDMSACVLKVPGYGNVSWCDAAQRLVAIDDDVSVEQRAVGLWALGFSIKNIDQDTVMLPDGRRMDAGWCFIESLSLVKSPLAYNSLGLTLDDRDKITVGKARNITNAKCFEMALQCEDSPLKRSADLAEAAYNLAVVVARTFSVRARINTRRKVSDLISTHLKKALEYDPYHPCALAFAAGKLGPGLHELPDGRKLTQKELTILAVKSAPRDSADIYLAVANGIGPYSYEADVGPKKRMGKMALFIKAIELGGGKRGTTAARLAHLYLDVADQVAEMSSIFFTEYEATFADGRKLGDMDCCKEAIALDPGCVRAYCNIYQWLMLNNKPDITLRNGTVVTSGYCIDKIGHGIAALHTKKK